MIDLVDQCAALIGLSRDSVLQLAKSSAFRNRRMEIPKRDGGSRVIWQAAIETKGIHLSLIDAYFKSLPVHSASQAFSPGSSIKKNAYRHLGRKFFLRVDLKDFFPSLSFEFFKGTMEINQEKFSFATITPDSLTLVRTSCFDRSGRLPIGYSTSPYIANAAMFGFDTNLTKELAERFGSDAFSYTRYADDLVLSTNERGLCRKAYMFLKEFVATQSGANLSINLKKTHFGSAAKGTAYVTGVHVLPEGRITATKKLRNEIRFKLSLLKKKKIPREEYERLRGLMAHLKHIDPAYYTKLATDYYSVFPGLK